MATFKCIEPTPETIRSMQTAMCDMDATVQDADEKIAALTESMKQMLMADRAIESKAHLVKLCDMIAGASNIAMNHVNWSAEQHHANWTDEVSHV